MEKYNLTQTGQEVQDILNNATPQSDLAEEVERAQEAERLLGEDIQQNADDIDAIEGKIPSAATSENKLADKEYVDGKVDDEKTRAQDAEQQNANDIDAIEAIIPSNASSENKLATSNDVGTVAQSVGTEETRAKAAEKQNADDIDVIESVIPLDATSENKLATVSDITTEATTRENADAALQSAIEAILLLIPSAASSLNKLADKAFVNSSIATNTATFRGTFNLVNDLHLTLAATHAQIGNALALAILDSDNNDYAYVQIPTVETAPNEIAQTDRYKFNGTSWEYEYTLNNSGFTSAQWTAINSGITSVLVSKLSELPTNSELTTDLGTLTSAITAINQKIPAAAAQNNKLVDTAALESYIVQVLGVLTVSYNITSTDGHVTLAIQQTDGKITSVSLTTSDIASAAALNLKASQADLTALANRVTTAEGNISTLSGRVSTNETDIAQLQAAYSGLTQSDIIIGALPASGVANKIYRVPGTNSYSDYMWNGTQFVLMATYNNAIDPRPRKASQNLVTSGGVFDNMGALDISELNATENPHTLATYAGLSAALAAIPSNDYKKGGMSIKFVQTDDNDYVRYNLLAQTFTTDTTQWAVDDSGVYVDNPKYIYVKTDSYGRILWALEADGNVHYGAGVPQQIIDYISSQIEAIKRGTDSTDIDGINKITAFLADFSTSDNLKTYLNEIYGEYTDSQEFVRIWTDKYKRKLFGIKGDGDAYFGVGVPSQIQKEIDKKYQKSQLYKAFYNEIFVAASDAPDDVKSIADFVCTGTNDEFILNSAVDKGGPNGKIRLSQGTFYIDSFKLFRISGFQDMYSAIMLPWDNGTPSLNVTITGNGERGANRTLLYVRETAWDSLPRDTEDETKEDQSIEPTLIVSRPYQGGTMNVGFLAIEVENNKHKICCINQQYNSGGLLDHIIATAAPNSHAETLPTEGCVALRSYHGSDDGTIQKWQHIVVIGFYEAFQIGAEHHILINCGGRYNYYCFTFGNYNYRVGTNDHPIVLINCCDEHSANLPLFARCGWHNDTEGQGHVVSEYPLQSVTIIGFNIEDSAIIEGTYANKAHENTPSSFCGRIEYTCGGVGQNSKTYIFWDSTSGKNFETKNLTHAKGGTTAQRLAYGANYMQHYYDTDLEKEVIYNGSAWVDCNGNLV